MGAWTATFAPVAAADQQQRADNGGTTPTGSDPVALTPEVKEAIAGEVKAQIAEEKTEAAAAPQAQAVSQEVPPALGSGPAQLRGRFRSGRHHRFR